MLTSGAIADVCVAIIAALCIGFHGGFFGPGIGSLFAVAFVAARGYNLIKATARAKVLVFTRLVKKLIHI